MSTNAIDVPTRPRSSNSKMRPYQASASSTSSTSSATWLIPMSRVIPTDATASRRRRQLEHGIRRGAAHDSPGGHVAAKLDHTTLAIKKHQVEWEEHPERVDAEAARDQEARPGALTRDQRQPEQAADPGRGDRDIEAEQLGALQPPKEPCLHLRI